MKFFPGQGKVREFCGWPGKFRKDLESQGKVREFEKKGYGRQSSENLFCSRGERMYFLKDSLSPSPSSFEAILKGKNLLPGEPILSFKSTPKFEVVQLAPLK